MKRNIPLERLQGLGANDQGLSEAEVAGRRSQYGDNRIIETIEGGWQQLLRETLKDPMLWFLLGTSVLFGLVGERTEAVVLLLALIPFLGMDAFLHRRTQASISGLSTHLASRARVVRNAGVTSIDATELVDGWVRRAAVRRG